MEAILEKAIKQIKEGNVVNEAIYRYCFAYYDDYIRLQEKAGKNIAERWKYRQLFRDLFESRFRKERNNFWRV